MHHSTPQNFGSHDAQRAVPQIAQVRRTFFRRKRRCPLSGPGAPEIDYKNTKLLLRFVSERGRILPRRITSVCAKKQRALKVAIKRARILALLPFVAE